MVRYEYGQVLNGYEEVESDDKKVVEHEQRLLLVLDCQEVVDMKDFDFVLKHEYSPC